MEVVKIQRPIIPPDGPWLVYDRRKKHVQEFAESRVPIFVKAALGDDLKGYFRGAWYAVDGWLFGERVEDQEW